jgi:hypothetical protein
VESRKAGEQVLRYVFSCVLSRADFPTSTREAANIALLLLLPFDFPLKSSMGKEKPRTWTAGPRLPPDNDIL